MKLFVNIKAWSMLAVDMSRMVRVILLAYLMNDKMSLKLFYRLMINQ